jgi:nucleotide-binding universal stress UspA family protein
MPKTKILVPMDGSDCALRALKWAAKAHEAELLVLNVQPALPRSQFVSKDMIAEHQERCAGEALARARALIQRNSLRAQTFSVVGDPAVSILAFAKKHRCAAIVMGSRGQGRIKKLVLGSVAAKVIHAAACPVTLVK